MAGAVTRIVVFEQAGSGQRKIAGIRAHGRDLEIVGVHDAPGGLPAFVDDPGNFIPDAIEADLVLDFMKHPDLSEYLALVCGRLGIPVIASGRKIAGAITPFTCCGLGRLPGLGAYGEQFGLPELEVRIEAGRIADLLVRRGASCGATWDMRARILGLPVAEAMSAVGREVQYLCFADPSRFDPISGKSALHHAGKVHIAALARAVEAAGRKQTLLE